MIYEGKLFSYFLHYCEVYKRFYESDFFAKCESGLSQDSLQYTIFTLFYAV
jgi:hypothetical protein